MQRFVFCTLSALSFGVTLFAGCTQDFSIFQVNGADTTATGGASSASTSVTTSVTTGGGAPETSTSTSTSTPTSSGSGCTSDASCDDQNPCTTDRCDAEGCAHEPQDGPAPSDENDCTTEVCKGGVLTTGFAEQDTICGIGLTCDGMGKCGGCFSDLQCMASGECKVAYCVKSTCVVQAVKEGTICTQGVCSMTGDCVECIDDKPCGPGKGCLNGGCIDVCKDGRTDGGESDIDCGGTRCPPCPEGKKCVIDKDCASGVCVVGICAAGPTCTDNLPNGDETDVDCGGPDCLQCTTGKKCKRDKDCLSDHCRKLMGTGICE